MTLPTFDLYSLAFSDVGVQDRVVVQEMLKNVAQANQLETSSQREFKGM